MYRAANVVTRGGWLLAYIGALLLVAGGSIWSQPPGIVTLYPFVGLEACYALVDWTLLGAPQSRVGEIRLKPNFSSRFWEGTEIIGVVYSGTDSVQAIPLGNNEVAFVPVYADTFLARTRLGEIKVIGYGRVELFLFGETTDAFHVELYTPGGQLLERSSYVRLERRGARELRLCRPDTIPPCGVAQIPVNTGYDPIRGRLLPPGSMDPYWIVISDPRPQDI